MLLLGAFFIRIFVFIVEVNKEIFTLWSRARWQSLLHFSPSHLHRSESRAGNSKKNFFELFLFFHELFRQFRFYFRFLFLLVICFVRSKFNSNKNLLFSSRCSFHSCRFWETLWRTTRIKWFRFDARCIHFVRSLYVALGLARECLLRLLLLLFYESDKNIFHLHIHIHSNDFIVLHIIYAQFIISRFFVFLCQCAVLVTVRVTSFFICWWENGLQSLSLPVYYWVFYRCIRMHQK